MSLTLRNILSWDADKVLDIAKAFTSIEESSDEHVKKIRQVLKEIDDTWSGKAKIEALQAIHQTNDDLIKHRHRITIMAKDFRIASQEIASVRHQVDTIIRAVNDDNQLRLSLDDNTVTTDFSTPEPDVVNKLRRYNKTITKILAEAAKVDNDLTAAIKFADGRVNRDLILHNIPSTDVIDYLKSGNDGSSSPNDIMQECEYDVLPNGMMVPLTNGAWIETLSHGERIVHHPPGSGLPDDYLQLTPVGVDPVSYWEDHFDPAHHIFPDPSDPMLKDHPEIIKQGLACELLGIPYSWGGGISTFGPGRGWPEKGYPESNQDGEKIGLDCSHYATFLDSLAYGREIQDGTQSIKSDPNYFMPEINDPDYYHDGKPAPHIGDSILCDPDAHGVFGHIRTYLGNGWWTEAPYSGGNIEIRKLGIYGPANSRIITIIKH